MDGQMMVEQTMAAPRPGRTKRARYLLAAVIAAVAASTAGASRVAPLNLVDLISRSDRILSGTVIRVATGRSADSMGYTEITLRVAESLLGAGGEKYTFRQAGRGGQDGLPTWIPGERVVLFLERPAPATGLQTTVGPLQGKLRHFEGRLSSSLDNEGLFTGVAIDASGLSLDQVAMLEGGTGVVDAEAFLDLVRRAVREDWIARGLMHRDAASTGALHRAASQSKDTGELRDGSP